MRIGIVGSTGLVGSQLKKILKSDHEVIELNRSNCNVVSLDVEHLAATLGNVDCIVNCAAIINQHDSAELLAVNALGALNVAKLAVSLNAKLIHISSIFCEQHDHNEYFNTYGISKLTGELLVKEYLENRGVEFSIVRCSQIYDLDWEACNSQPLFYHLISRAIHDSKITLYGNRDVERNFVSLQTVTNSIKYMIENDVDRAGYILGDTLLTSELIIKISNALARPVEVVWCESKPSLKKVHIPSMSNNFAGKFKTDLIDDIREIIAREKN